MEPSTDYPARVRTALSRLEIRAVVLEQNAAARRVNARIDVANPYVALQPLYALATGTVLPGMPVNLNAISALSHKQVVDMFDALEIQRDMIGNTLKGWGGMNLHHMKLRLALQLGAPMGPMYYVQLPNESLNGGQTSD